MNPVLPKEFQEVMESVHYRPAISIIIPFEPKMNLRNSIVHSLKLAADRVERELLENYSGEIVALMMQKLKNIIRGLNFDTHKKSIAIYLSPVFEKVLYLDIAVNEKIVIDESFEIRDLIYSKKQSQKYLVLLLSAKESRIYLGNAESLVRIVSNTPESAYAYLNELPERVSNFSDVAERRQVMLDKFLRHVDNALGFILKAYRLPLFVLGTKKVLGHFKQVSRHGGTVIEYIHGNFEDAGVHELRAILRPHIEDWKRVRQLDLLNQIEEAAGKRKLSTGMEEVWLEASRHRGRLLIVEKDFAYAGQYGSHEGQLFKAVEPYYTFSYIKDAVDDVIEKVLESGGDVEFVENGFLANYKRIALVQYYA